jgi:hypothetical protein
MNFAEKLNAGKFEPKVSSGAVSLVVDNPRPVGRPATAAELEAVGFSHGHLDDHPEGADRGGYVPFVFDTEGEAAIWDIGDYKWRLAY